MSATNLHKPVKPTRSQRRFKLPESPWTYGSDSFNPDLHPSNTLRRRNVESNSDSDDSRPLALHYNVPPYHPSYNSTIDDVARRSWSASSFSGGSEMSTADFEPLVRPDASEKVAARLGPEGWEVRQPGFRVDDEDEVVGAGQISNVIQAPGRYRRYVSEQSSTEESDIEDREAED